MRVVMTAHNWKKKNIVRKCVRGGINNIPTHLITKIVAASIMTVITLMMLRYINTYNLIMINGKWLSVYLLIYK